MSKGICKVRLSLWAGALSALALSGSAMNAPSVQTREAFNLRGRAAAERSEPLCRALAASADGLSVHAESVIGARPNGTERPFWLVDCSDPGGADVAHLIWDDRTGLLECISRQTPSQGERTAKPITRRQAQMLAGHWLQRLPIAESGSRWRQSWESRSEMTWQFGWRSGARTARVVIDARNGDLLSLVAYSPQA